MKTVCYFSCGILTKIGIRTCRQIVVTIPNTNFHENSALRIELFRADRGVYEADDRFSQPLRGSA